jgi:uncharacterized protein YbjT (DUF2867 family)
MCSACRCQPTPKKALHKPNSLPTHANHTAPFMAHATLQVMTKSSPQANAPTRTALLAGSTGLVGRELLALLLADSRYSTVHCVGRRAPAVTHPKLVAHTVGNMADPAQLSALPKADDVFIALGTTIKVAGSQAAFKAVDYDAVVALALTNIAEAATNSGARDMRIGVVSAMGADAKSGVFYNRTKGEMEAALSHLGYASVSIARPSMLAGDRASLAQPARPGEQIGLKLMGAINFLIPANYKAIEAADVAAALHKMVALGASGTRVALSGELRDLAGA